ncbi:cobaltochelatase [alpha proteobacterium BAL199]|jgi:hypothetical protein|nr:cobaltochelatase [alpha proteobacterium BAL199]
MTDANADDLTPNLPEVVAEIRALFERYEKALVEKDVDVLDATFWNSPYTIRYAMNEMGYGFEAIHQHRVNRKPGTRHKGEPRRVEILTLGRRFATVNYEYHVRDSDLIGRQSQSWVNFPDVGWKVVAAHVSTTNGQPVW